MSDLNVLVSAMAYLPRVLLANKREQMELMANIFISIPYSLDQTLLLISRHSRIVATPSDVLNEIVAALEY